MNLNGFDSPVDVREMAAGLEGGGLASKDLTETKFTPSLKSLAHGGARVARRGGKAPGLKPFYIRSDSRRRWEKNNG